MPLSLFTDTAHGACPPSPWIARLTRLCLLPLLSLSAGLCEGAPPAYRGWERLIVAASEANKEEVQRLLAEGKSAEQQGEEGLTPLIAAAQHGSVEVVDKLLQAGARASTAHDSGLTALMVASQQGHLAVVQRLLAAGPFDLDQIAQGGWTALRLAAFNGHAPVVEVLCQAGAQLELQDRIGRTALLSAVLEGHALVVEVLCRAVARLDRQVGEGTVTLMLLSRLGQDRGLLSTLKLASSSLLSRGYTGSVRATHGIMPSTASAGEGVTCTARPA